MLYLSLRFEIQELMSNQSHSFLQHIIKRATKEEKFPHILL
jgi:hypothetical protein